MKNEAQISFDGSPLLPESATNAALLVYTEEAPWNHQPSVMPQVRAKALRGIGAAVSALMPRSQGHSNSSSAGDLSAQSSRVCTAALDAFLTSVEGARRATEPTEMRIAAVQALQASTLLHPSAAAKGELHSPLIRLPTTVTA